MKHNAVLGAVDSKDNPRSSRFSVFVPSKMITPAIVRRRSIWSFEVDSIFLRFIPSLWYVESSKRFCYLYHIMFSTLEIFSIYVDTEFI